MDQMVVAFSSLWTAPSCESSLVLLWFQVQPFYHYIYVCSGPAKALFEQAYFEKVYAALKPGGIMCMQGKLRGNNNTRRVENTLQTSLQINDTRETY